MGCYTAIQWNGTYTPSTIRCCAWPQCNIEIEIFHLCNNNVKRSRVGSFISEFKRAGIRLSPLLTITSTLRHVSFAFPEGKHVCSGYKKRVSPHTGIASRAQPSETVCNLLQLHPVKPAIPPVSIRTHCVTHLPCWASLRHICLVVCFTTLIASTCGSVCCYALTWRTGVAQLQHSCASQQQLLKPTVRFSWAGPMMEELCNALWQRKTQPLLRNCSFG